MTKVQVEFRFGKPLDEGLLDQIASAHAIYGLSRLELSPALDKVLVDYDASRLTPAQVEAALRGMGLPIGSHG